jgi:hypothetical protein
MDNLQGPSCNLETWPRFQDPIVTFDEQNRPAAPQNLYTLIQLQTTKAQLVA